MKKIIPFYIILLAPLFTTSAQKSYWVIGSGYSLPSSQQTLFVLQDLRYPGFNRGSSNKSIHGSYGAGLSFNTGFHQISKNNWGWGIDVSYLFGNKMGSDTKVTSPNGSFEQVKLASKSNALFITPLVIKNFESEGKVQPYLIAGLIMGAPKVVTDYSLLIDYGNSTPNHTANVKDEVTHRFSVGTKLAVGMNIKSEKKSILFIDFEFNIMSAWQKELKQLGGSGETIVFEKEFDLPSGQGNKEIADTAPFGSIGIRVGYKFHFK